MKKSVKVLMILLIGSLSFSANAQIFGVEGSVGLSNISSPQADISDLYGRILGIKLGGTIELDITDELYVGSGLSFARKGATTSNDNFNLLYLEVPISARYNTFEIGDSGEFYFSAGFYLAPLLSAKIGDTKLDIGTDIKGFDLGMNGGVGVIFDDRFDIGLSYESGFLDFSANEFNEQKNVAIMLSFGYKFDM
ncbi:porin family protein [Zobellia uliginosa]|uniref:porin family protein n=1 Tax=Zobellia uliginosa TaxID=143224 RepID=UPI001C0731B9|nr:porin family protein [Zobellia uliginosa]MBU2945769.1 PorT family protein [Zobellia uliginosa]